MATGPWWVVSQITLPFLTPDLNFSARTNVPAHLWIRFDTIKPRSIPIYRNVRGLEVLCGYRYFWPSATDLEQIELGDTTLHTFPPVPCPDGARLYFHFWSVPGPFGREVQSPLFIHECQFRPEDEMVLIEEIFLGAPANDFNFSGIPPGFRHLMLLGQLRSSRPTIHDNIMLRFNGDVSAIYDWYVRAAIVGTRSDAGVADDDHIELGFGAANSAPGNAFDAVQVWIPNYSVTTHHKTLKSQGSDKTGTGISNWRINSGIGYWRSNNSITDIMIYPNIGPQWLAASVMSLYGLP